MTVLLDDRRSEHQVGRGHDVSGLQGGLGCVADYLMGVLDAQRPFDGLLLRDTFLRELLEDVLRLELPLDGLAGHPASVYLRMLLHPSLEAERDADVHGLRLLLPFHDI